MVETLEKEETQCPFAEWARHCSYQETYAQDVSAAIEAKVVFVCTLDKGDNCPYFRRCIEE